MSGLRALRTLCAGVATAATLGALACLLPDNPHQRWRLADGTIYDRLSWAYERIHCDDRPIDVAIAGSSRGLLGISANRIEQQLSARGLPANVANLSVIAEGRNVQWAALAELFKAKSPRVIVLVVNSEAAPYGHPAFRLVAPASAIAFPPAPLLHNYFYDLAALPSRQVKLFAANLLPTLVGLPKDFDPQRYTAERSDFTSGVLHMDNKTFDMDREVPASTLRAQSQARPHVSWIDRLIFRCCNDGDDRVYIREIGKLAEAHGARLIFAFVPTFEGSTTIDDRDFFSRRGRLVDASDIAGDAALYENWAHLNHAGAVKVSDRIAEAIANLRTSSLEPQNAR